MRYWINDDALKNSAFSKSNAWRNEDLARDLMIKKYWACKTATGPKGKALPIIRAFSSLPISLLASLPFSLFIFLHPNPLREASSLPASMASISFSISFSLHSHSQSFPDVNAFSSLSLCPFFRPSHHHISIIYTQIMLWGGEMSFIDVHFEKCLSWQRTGFSHAKQILSNNPIWKLPKEVNIRE